MTILWMILFPCSLVGASYAAKRALGIDAAFIPALVISTETMIVYLAGLGGLLRPGALLVLLLGLAGAVWLAVDWAERRWRPRPPSAFWSAFLAGALVFLAFLKGQRLEHYDNFSHWAVIVKVMLLTDAYPTPADRLVEFTNYPPGAATWIYLVCSFLGHAQGTMLLAQGLLVFALFAAIFGMITRTRVFMAYTILALGCSALSFFNVTIRITSLLVDFLLPLFVLAAWALAKRYSGTLIHLLVLVPLLSLLLLVKSTGVVFCVFALLGCLVENLRARGRRRSGLPAMLGAALVLLGVLAAVYWSWSHRVATVFAGASNKFETSAGAILSQGEKSPSEIEGIVSAFLARSLDLTQRPTIGLLAGNLLVLLIVVVLAVRTRTLPGALLASVLLLDLMTLAYYAGILAMYIFSMPIEEAASLDGFDRYASSIVVLFAGGIAMALTREYEARVECATDGAPSFATPSARLAYQRAVLAGLAICALVLTSEYAGMRASAQGPAGSTAARIEAVTSDRWPEGGVEDERRYLFYGSDRDGLMTNFYFTYVSRYLMYAPNVDAIVSFYEDNMDNLLADYDVLVVVEPDPIETSLLAEHYGVDGSAGFYTITREGGSIGLTPEEEE